MSVTPSNQRTYKVRADEITRLREHAGMSIDQLATRSAVSTNTLRRWLRGEPATLARLNQVAKKLGVDCDVLIDREAESVIASPSTLANDAMAGQLVLTLRIPGSFKDYDVLRSLPSLLERVDDFFRDTHGPIGEVSLSFVREGSILFGLLFATPDDAQPLIKHFCELYDTDHDGGQYHFPFDEVSFENPPFDSAKLIADALFPRIYDATRVHSSPAALAEDFRQHPAHQWEFIVISLGPFFHGTLTVTRIGDITWKITTRLFWQTPEFDQLVQIANDYDLPRLVAGELPPGVADHPELEWLKVLNCPQFI